MRLFPITFDIPVLLPVAVTKGLYYNLHITHSLECSPIGTLKLLPCDIPVLIPITCDIPVLLPVAVKIEGIKLQS